MSKIIYSTVQIKELESNKYVEKSNSKQIRFTDTFKIVLLKIIGQVIILQRYIPYI